MPPPVPRSPRVPVKVTIGQLWNWLQQGVSVKDALFFVFSTVGLGGFALALFQNWQALPVVPRTLIATSFVGFSMLAMSGLLNIVRRTIDRAWRLNVHVGRFSAGLENQEESRDYFILGDLCHFSSITVGGLEITNRTAEDMSIDCSIRLSLKSRSVFGKMFFHVGEHHLQEKWRQHFTDGCIPVPGHKTVEVSKVFGLKDTDVLVIGGLKNLSDNDAHLLILTDRVTDRTRMVPFGLV
jgi:hypothetical protein